MIERGTSGFSKPRRRGTVASVPFRAPHGPSHSAHTNSSSIGEVSWRAVPVLFLSLTAIGLWGVVSCTDRSQPPAPSGALSAPAGNRPPVITSARFLNDPLSLTEPVAVQIFAEDPEREAVSYAYQWYVDGAPLKGQTNATLPAELLRRGQRVGVEIVPADATQKGPAYRVPPVVVGNTPPTVQRVTIRPPAARPGDRLEAQAEAGDPDHDRVDLTYRWFKNNVLVKEGEEGFLDTRGFAAQDQIAVEVTARDPSAVGNTVRSDQLVMGNSLPKIVSTPPVPGTPDSYTYAVKAVDSDGDALTYHLEAAPSGMTIGERTGQIEWRVPANQPGVHHVKIVVKDGRGGAASQEFDLTLTAAPSPAKPAGA